MSIFDALKNSVVNNFNTNVSMGQMLLGLSVSLLAGLFILMIYKRVNHQVSYNRSFCLPLLLICSISAMIVLTITSNLALSLGMVGALSIVRFRTAIKDAADTVFLFWAVAAGITAGAGFYLLTVVGCLFVGLVCIIALTLSAKSEKPFLLVVRASDAAASDLVEAALIEANATLQLASLVENDSYLDVIYEIGCNDQTRKLALAMKAIPGITSVSLVDCRKS